MSKAKRCRVGSCETNAPHELSRAAIELQDLVGKGADNIAHILANDTAENFQVIALHIATCREALDEIEEMARHQLAYEAAYYRESWKSIKALGVLKKAD